MPNRCPDVFPQILNFMYAGNVELTLETCVPLLALADVYLIKELKERCNTFIREKVNSSTALPMLEKALQFNAQVINFQL